jgi:molecular chaperone GrpE (heat shock protein)/DNA-binding Xre family transcriptional regulator
MKDDIYRNNRRQLQYLMEQVGIVDIRDLSRVSGISQWQLTRLEYGLLAKMPVEILLKLSDALKVPASSLLAVFCPDLMPAADTTLASLAARTRELEVLRGEYQHLQKRQEQQREQLTQEFQQASLSAIEPFLLQWPTAEAAAKKKPQLGAVKILPLVKPIMELIKRWGIEPIGTVAEQTPYNPQIHQVMEGVANPGDLVQVRYLGYRQGEKILYRAKVSLMKIVNPLEDRRAEEIPAKSPVTI